MDYPQRTSHFAHKTFRLLHKTCFAATAGVDAFSLLAIILHTEDAARYAGPVCFWNSQLQETLGFAKWDRLNRARQKAIDAGWLFYDSPGRRQIGTYFVTVPAGLEMISDLPLEPLPPLEGYKEGYNEGYKKGDKEGYKRGFTEGLRRGEAGDKQGEPSIPVPEPKPKRGKRSQFTIPTAEQVASYCKERGNAVDAETFVDFNTSKGWMVGKNKMKDWKAAVRTWEKRENSTPARSPGKPAPLTDKQRRINNNICWDKGASGEWLYKNGGYVEAATGNRIDPETLEPIE